ncbi:hypothetical protein NPIL_654271 [Nephila pilipes]|uniref:Uncharacterized protein n=1 Tax=Nephila pilipes TaxID=299642 RepID=A0A8X6NEN1_NEPPI|nr:hypothetical protein NPIL_654271 [Nephila pilipes]
MSSLARRKRDQCPRKVGHSNRGVATSRTDQPPVLGSSIFPCLLFQRLIEVRLRSLSNNQAKIVLPCYICQPCTLACNRLTSRSKTGEF